MSTVDQFASVFNAASQTAVQHQPPALENALVVTDLEPDAAENYAGSVRTFFGAVTGKWETVHGGEFATVKELLNLVESRKPGLIVKPALFSSSSLNSGSYSLPLSLSSFVSTTPMPR